jgi:hypothetical protein
METLRKAIAYNIREYDTGNGNQYRRLLIRITKLDNYERDPNRPLYSFHKSIEIDYQGTSKDRGTDDFHWYAPHVDINSSYLEDHLEYYKLLAKLIPSNSLEDVDGLIESLKSKATFYYYDVRLDQHVTQLMPADFHPYKEDNDASLTPSFYCKVLARDEDEAKRSIYREFTRHLAESYEGSDTEKAFNNWINAGKPVKQIEYSYWTRKQDFRTPDQLIASEEPENVEYSINL